MSRNEIQVLCKFLFIRIQFVYTVLENLMQFEAGLLYRTGPTAQEYVVSTVDLTEIGTYMCMVTVSIGDSEFSEPKVISGQSFFSNIYKCITSQ